MPLPGWTLNEDTCWLLFCLKGCSNVVNLFAHSALQLQPVTPNTAKMQSSIAARFFGPSSIAYIADINSALIRFTAPGWCNSLSPEK